MGEQRYTRVLLKAEYVDTPLWDRTPGRMSTSIDYSELNLSVELAAKLEAWNDRFAATAFEGPDAGEQEEFRVQGLELASELQSEVGERVEIIYVDGIHGIPADPAPVRSDTPGEYRWSTE